MTGLDTALRNRLTGAIILVLIAVLLLPELLTGSGGAAGRSAPAGSATRDAAGAPLQTLQIDLSGSARAPAGSPSAALPETPEDAQPPPGPVQLPVPEVSQPPAEATPQAPVQESVPAPVPEPVQQPAQQPARAPVVPEAVPATPAAAPAPGATRYFVQVGTFATRERAEAAQKDLARRGFEVIINETTSGARQFHRVRVGPVADRATAVALEARLRPLAPDRAIVAVPPAP
jgi:cell division septation protein DedD